MQWIHLKTHSRKVKYRGGSKQSNLKLFNFSGSNGTVKAAPVPLGQDCYRWKENWSLIFLTWRFFITFRKSTSECIFFLFRQQASFVESCLLCFFCNVQKVYDDFINVQQVSFWWLCAEKKSFWYFLMIRKSVSDDIQCPESRLLKIFCRELRTLCTSGCERQGFAFLLVLIVALLHS